MVKVNMPPVPVVVPVRIMSRGNVIAKAGKALSQLSGDLRTRRLCARITGLRLYVRGMTERREARPCTLKVRNAMRGAHSAKPDAASAAANSMCDLSATMEPTCLEAATAMETTTPAEVTAARVTATTKPTATESSTSAAVPSRPCYGTERHGRDANDQINYLFYLHSFIFVSLCFATMARPRDFVMLREMH